jgi:hypothetical protein
MQQPPMSRELLSVEAEGQPSLIVWSAILEQWVAEMATLQAIEPRFREDR